MFGHYGQSGSIAVQPVRTTEDERLSLLLIVVHQPVGERVFIVVERWVDGHARGFVYYDDILVLIDDIKGKFYRRYIRRGFRFLNMDSQDITVFHGCAHIGPCSVQENAFSHFLKSGQILI